METISACSAVATSGMIIPYAPASSSQPISRGSWLGERTKGDALPADTACSIDMIASLPNMPCWASIVTESKPACERISAM